MSIPKLLLPKFRAFRVFRGSQILASLALFASPFLSHADDDKRTQSKAARVVSIRAAAGGDATPVDVVFTIDKSTYRSGEIPVIRIKPAADCRVSLFYKDAEGTTLQLFPNKFITSDKFKGGKEVQLLPAPNPTRAGDKVAIEIFGPPFGKEQFILVATAEPTALLASTKSAKAVGPFLNATTKAARVVTRVIKVNEAPQTSVATGPVTARGKGTAAITITTKKE